MFGKKKKRWKVSLKDFGDIPIRFANETEWEFDLNHTARVTIHVPVIDCDNGGTCQNSAPGGLIFEVTPID